MAVLNAYLRVHGSTSSLPRKFEVKEYTGRTFFNDDILGGSAIEMYFQFMGYNTEQTLYDEKKKARSFSLFCGDMA